MKAEDVEALRKAAKLICSGESVPGSGGHQLFASIVARALLELLQQADDAEKPDVAFVRTLGRILRDDEDGVIVEVEGPYFTMIFCWEHPTSINMTHETAGFNFRFIGRRSGIDWCKQHPIDMTKGNVRSLIAALKGATP